jgi:hypothetical protein
MWSAIASVVLGVCGWGLAKLLFEPLKEIIDLRREAQECLIVYGDLHKDAPADERRHGAETFCRIGAGLVSHHYAAYPWVTWDYTSGLRWDIHSVGEMLIRIGKGIQFTGYSWPNNSADVLLIRKSLRLPYPELSPLDRELMAHAGKPAPLDPGQL